MKRDYFYRKQIIEIFGFDEPFLDRLEAEELIRSVEMEAEPERVFQPDQMERIRIISNLVQDLEVNLAGVEVILEMRENMIRMQQQFNEILETLIRELKIRMG